MQIFVPTEWNIFSYVFSADILFLFFCGCMFVDMKGLIVCPRLDLNMRFSPGMLRLCEPLRLRLTLFILIVIACIIYVLVCACMCDDVYMESRGQLGGGLLLSFHRPHGVWGSTLSSQDWWWEPFPCYTPRPWNSDPPAFTSWALGLWSAPSSPVFFSA